MLLLGIDVGTSSIKVSVVDGNTQRCLAAAQYPDTETEVIALQPGWAEQSPDKWWQDVQQAIFKVHASGAYNPLDIGAIGISYQMHGLVLLDAQGETLRNSIIWCDSRAVPYGEAAAQRIGRDICLQHLLNSPGNFTAAKLAWVKEQEPAIYERIDKIMLPGDFIAQRLTGTVTATPSSLSEGIFWDFQQNDVSEDVMGYFGFEYDFIPPVQPVFSPHGLLRADVAAVLALKAGIPVTYKAGDQPNNAFSLNVLQPGEVAATAGTSGVIYAVSGEPTYDGQSRVNSFAHVNHAAAENRVGVLLCINGTGILNRWIRNNTGGAVSYAQMNAMAAAVPAGSEGLLVLPFGNGAERMLNNRIVGAHLHNLDLNMHTTPHIFRAGQEGIAFAFRYGLDIMRQNGINPTVIRAGKANMFLSDVFAEAFVNATGVPVELHESDGSIGAALGAGVGAGYFTGSAEAFSRRSMLGLIEPRNTAAYNRFYEQWKDQLLRQIAES